MSRARFSCLLLLALPLAACAKSAPPLPEPEATAIAPVTKAAPSAAPVASASPTAATTPSAAPDPSGAPRAGGAAPIALPPATDGMLAPGAADKVLAVGAPAIVRMLDPGAEPRADLSYAITVGPAPRLAMDMDMALKMNMGAGRNETKLPRMGMMLEGSVAETNPAGEWKILAKLVDVTVDGKSGDSATIAAAMRPQLQAMKGLGLHYWLTPKGRIRDAKVDLPPGFPASAQPMVAGVNQSFESMVAPLPNEPVGVGARWQVVSRMAASGADLLQSAIYTLTARASGKVTLQVATTQLSASDQIKAADAAGGSIAHIKAFRSSGLATTHLDTTSVVPESGTTTMSTAMTVGVPSVPNGENAVETETTVNLSRPGK